MEKFHEILSQAAALQRSKAAVDLAAEIDVNEDCTDLTARMNAGDETAVLEYGRLCAAKRASSGAKPTLADTLLRNRYIRPS